MEIEKKAYSHLRIFSHLNNQENYLLQNEKIISF